VPTVRDGVAEPAESVRPRVGVLTSGSDDQWLGTVTSTVRDPGRADRGPSTVERQPSSSTTTSPTRNVPGRATSP
jgi:hypothetical protein